jgi:hypothetical protein
MPAEHRAGFAAGTLPSFHRSDGRLNYFWVAGGRQAAKPRRAVFLLLSTGGVIAMRTVLVVIRYSVTGAC